MNLLLSTCYCNTAYTLYPLVYTLYPLLDIHSTQLYYRVRVEKRPGKWKGVCNWNSNKRFRTVLNLMQTVNLTPGQNNRCIEMKFFFLGKRQSTSYCRDLPGLGGGDEGVLLATGCGGLCLGQHQDKQSPVPRATKSCSTPAFWPPGIAELRAGKARGDAWRGILHALALWSYRKS